MNEFVLHESDTINLDGTVTRLECPFCGHPVQRRNGQRNPGYLCDNRAEGQKHPLRDSYTRPGGAHLVPDMVTYHPVVRRYALEVRQHA